MIAVFLADGFEEIEALAVVDILRRAELQVVTVGVGGRTVCGSHGIPVAADAADSDWRADKLECVVLPGGMPGTLHLEKSPIVQQTVEAAAEKGIYLCAICAAPSILGHKGLLRGRRAVCFPGYEQELYGAAVQEAPVVVDGHIITAKGAGVAIEFALEIVSVLAGDSVAARLKASMQCQ